MHCRARLASDSPGDLVADERAGPGDRCGALGVTVNNIGSLLAAATEFGVLNTLLKPLLRPLTLPLAILTFGLKWSFVSLFVLVLTKAIVVGFHIHGSWTLVKATLIVWW